MMDSSSAGNSQSPFSPEKATKQVRYYGGSIGALVPFFVFVAGVVTIALSGAPDERGFWPVLIFALILGLLLARDKKTFSEVVIEGMSKPIVMIMIMAWVLASIIGVLMSITGFIEALTWLAGRLSLGGTAFVLAAFIICCIVSISTGSSIGTILICGPILYPAGGLLGSNLAILAGAIIGGATFGDSIAPISDTTIASALSQKADIGGTVRSRMKYVLPAATLAFGLYVLRASLGKGGTPTDGIDIAGSPRGLPMIIVPVVIIALLLSRRHLLHGLLIGIIVGVAVGIGFGLLPFETVISLDLENFSARSFVIDGINRAVGICFFTIFLMGIVAALEASGFLKKLVDFSAGKSHSKRSAEMWIAGTVGAAVLLTCHSIVAILTVGEFSRRTGEGMGIHRYRRANLLSLTVSTFPFILPYFIPVILVANATASGAEYGIPSVSPLQAGLNNFYSWAVMAMVIFALVSGFGRDFAKDETDSAKEESHV